MTSPQYHFFSFETPIYQRPSDHFREFVKNLETTEIPCYALCQSNGKLTFQLSNSKKASATPCVKKHPQREVIIKRISRFASKFNAASSIAVKQEAEMKLDILERGNFKPKRLKKFFRRYGTDIQCIIQVTVKTDDQRVLEVLAKFFKMLDTCGN